jgi:uncharacterized protein DUF3943
MGPLGAAITGVLVTALGAGAPAVAPAVPEDAAQTTVPAAPGDAPQPALPAVPRDSRDTETLKPIGPRPHPYLALLETAAAVAGGAVWYYRDLKFNSPDFDYNWSGHTWEEKLLTFQADRFDDNRFDTNVFWHPFDGTWIYLIARGNRLSPGAAFLITAAMSVFWEYVVEYREVAAPNDMIFTPLAGIAIGEPMIRTAALLREGELGPVGRGLAAVLDPVGAINGAFEGGHRRGGEETDEHGLPLRYPHRLEFLTGAGYAAFAPAQARAEAELGADVFVDATPELASPGRRADTVGVGTITAMAGGGALADGRFVGVNLDTLVSLVGRQTRIAEGPDDVLVTRARRLYWGLGSGFEYSSRTRPGMTSDLIGSAKLLGPVVSWELDREDFRLQVLATASYDFSLVTSLALDDYTVVYGVDALPHVLSQKRYYYAQGYSAALRAIADFGRWELGTSLRDDAFWWIHGRNRIEPQIPEPSASDRREMARLWLGVRPWADLPFKLTVVGEGTIRSGSLGPFSESLSERRVSTLLGLLF